MGRFTTGMKGPDAIQKLNELDASVQGAVDGAAEAIRQAEAARDATFDARDVTDGYRAIAVAAGLTATEKAAQAEAARQEVATTAATVEAARAAVAADAQATAQDRAAVGQEVSSALVSIDTAAGAALTSIATEVGRSETAAAAADQSRAQAALRAGEADTAAGIATAKAEQTAAAAEATAGDRQATGEARGEAITAAGTATAKAELTAADAVSTAADRVATEAARSEAVTAAGTATSKATATAADAEATGSDRAIVLTARGEAIQGAVDALAAADASEGHVEAAATILALVQQHGNGWTPAIANVIDGDRRVQRIVSWSGGVGSMPAVGYVGAAGLVATPAEATDLRGGRGADGEGTGTASSVNGVMAVDGDIAVGIANIPGLQQALAAAGQVKTVAGVAPDSNGDVPLDAASVGADAAGTAAAEVAGLGEALAPVAYTGEASDLEGLSALLGGKAPISHTHAISQVDGLDAALASKATTAALTALDEVVDQKASATSVVAISDALGTLSESVASKADAGVVGALDDLDTTEKGSLVGAINEVNAKPPPFAVLTPSTETTFDTLTPGLRFMPATAANSPGNPNANGYFVDTKVVTIGGNPAVLQTATANFDSVGASATPVTYTRAKLSVGGYTAWTRGVTADAAGHTDVYTLAAAASLISPYLIGVYVVAPNLMESIVIEPAMSSVIFVDVTTFGQYFGTLSGHSTIVLPESMPAISAGYMVRKMFRIKQAASGTAWALAFFGATVSFPAGTPVAPALGKTSVFELLYVAGTGWIGRELYSS